MNILPSVFLCFLLLSSCNIFPLSFCWDFFHLFLFFIFIFFYFSVSLQLSIHIHINSTVRQNFKLTYMLHIGQCSLHSVSVFRSLHMVLNLSSGKKKLVLIAMIPSIKLLPGFMILVIVLLNLPKPKCKFPQFFWKTLVSNRYLVVTDRYKHWWLQCESHLVHTKFTALSLHTSEQNTAWFRRKCPETRFFQLPQTVSFGFHFSSSK
jgi:hypothetical protein